MIGGCGPHWTGLFVQYFRCFIILGTDKPSPDGSVLFLDLSYYHLEQLLIAVGQ